MRKPIENRMSAEELVNLINGKSGWIVTGGHKVNDIRLPVAIEMEVEEPTFYLPFKKKVAVYGLPVTKASLVGGILKIETSDRSFDLPSDNIVHDPWYARRAVEIRHTYLHRQQRKKIEGGGWHEVPAVGVTLTLRNPVMEEVEKKAREEQYRREEEERERREAEAYEAARQQFVTKLASEFVGKKITKIDVDENLHIEFEDGSKLSAVLDGDNTYDAWINVNNTSLRTFKKED